jgi:hypothetical protein
MSKKNKIRAKVKTNQTVQKIEKVKARKEQIILDLVNSCIGCYRNFFFTNAIKWVYQLG